jgi:hypothetical protein
MAITAMRGIEDALPIAERFGDDLALAHARSTLGFALAHRDTDAERDRGQKLRTSTWPPCKATAALQRRARRPPILVTSPSISATAAALNLVVVRLLVVLETSQSTSAIPTRFLRLVASTPRSTSEVPRKRGNGRGCPQQRHSGGRQRQRGVGGGGTGLRSPGLNVAFSTFGNGNMVGAGPGPLAIAGVIGKSGVTVTQTITGIKLG